MAHKTMINGAEYSITGGKCSAGGTEYTINSGKTLIGGTEYAIILNNGTATITAYFTNESELMTEVKSLNMMTPCLQLCDELNTESSKQNILFEATGNNLQRLTIAKATLGTYLCVLLYDSLDAGPETGLVLLNGTEVYSGDPKGSPGVLGDYGDNSGITKVWFQILGDIDVLLKIWDIPISSTSGDSSTAIECEVQVNGKAEFIKSEVLMQS